MRDNTTNHRIYTTSVASVYPHYVAKADQEGRTKSQVDKLIDELAHGLEMNKILR